MTRLFFLGKPRKKRLARLTIRQDKNYSTPTIRNRNLKPKKGKERKKRKNKLASGGKTPSGIAQNFADFQRERVLNRDRQICGVSTPHTNPTNYNKWLRVHAFIIIMLAIRQCVVVLF